MIKLTPMMRQYREAKAQAPPGAILLFRLGDFYEMFGEDARAAAPLLGIALTSRQTVPMCGIPYHAASGYIGKLLKAGLKVAVCDQMEDPAQAQGIVKREVTRIITPGTMLEEEFLEGGKNNYLAAVQRVGKIYGLAFLDISTGEFRLTETPDALTVLEEFNRLRPGEIVASAGVIEELGAGSAGGLPSGAGVTVLEDWRFDYELAYEALCRQFGTSTLDGFGCACLIPAVAAGGAVVEYVRENLRGSAAHVRSLRVYDISEFMALDSATLSSLEVVEPMRGGDDSLTLFGVLKKTLTPMGTRTLRNWLLRPLIRVEGIVRRHQGIADLLARPGAVGTLREELRGMRDLQRLIGRISSGNPNARDLAAIRDSLRKIPVLKKELSALAGGIWDEIGQDLRDFSALTDVLSRGLVDSPPLSLGEGGMIRPGYNSELDELHGLARDGRGWISRYQQTESERTGIKSLKVRYNKVFGYFIEVSNPNLALVPGDYLRKQTLVNAERFITEPLKEYESRVLGAQERAAELERRLFGELREIVRREGREIQETAASLAVLDALLALAAAAAEYGYVRPVLDEGAGLEIRSGRHPVVERALPPGVKFVGNDTVMDPEKSHLHIITGPNMAGKSTYIRQVALLVLMAQAGSYVPAESARIGTADRIFARVGASDELSRGQSTFMVEMTETANILHHVTPKSLVILDEIGRGTSTFDGISIAWAVAEYLHDNPARRARTLFATHYHELTELEISLERAANFNVAVREWNDRVIFLHKVLPGGTDKSYGIQVARLAGLPIEVIERARGILSGLEAGTLTGDGMPKFAPVSRSAASTPRQLTFFEADLHPVLDELRNLRLEHLTPFEAMQRLKELKERI